MTTLQERINESADFYREKYGTLDGKWKDEELPAVILDHLGSCELTEADREYLRELGAPELADLEGHEGLSLAPTGPRGSVPRADGERMGATSHGRKLPATPATSTPGFR